MRHPTDGTLRRLLDEPAGVPDPDRQHVAGCPVCLAGLAEARQAASVTAAALDTDVVTDVDRGWLRLTAATSARTPARTPGDAPSRSATGAPPPRGPRAPRTPVRAGGAGPALVAGRAQPGRRRARRRDRAGRRGRRGSHGLAAGLPHRPDH